MSIYSEIKKKFIMRNAYEDWTEYRIFLTDIILKLRGADNKKTVAIMGAGRCNDVDIHKLCAGFKEVKLVDCDSYAMGEALKGLTNPEIWKMYVKEVSFTGIKEKDISVFCEETVSALRTAGRTLDTDGFSGIILDGLGRLRNKMTKSADELAEKLPKSDILVCNGVFSQLFSTISFFIRSCAASYNDFYEAADRADEILMQFSQKLVPVITGAMLKSAGEYAIFCNEYSDVNPVEGACRCIETLRSENRIAEESKIIWHFNKAECINYEMLMQIVKI